MEAKSGQEFKTGTKRHPYKVWEGTKVWSVLDVAIAELVENRDLEEATPHEYIVGYLTKRLAEENII